MGGWWVGHMGGMAKNVRLLGQVWTKITRMVCPDNFPVVMQKSSLPLGQCFPKLLLFPMFSSDPAIFFQNITTPFTGSGGHKTGHLSLICKMFKAIFHTYCLMGKISYSKQRMTGKGIRKSSCSMALHRRNFAPPDRDCLWGVAWGDLG